MNTTCYSPLEALASLIRSISNSNNSIEEILRNLPSGIPDYSNDLYTVKQMLAHNNPMTVAAEYPTVTNNRFVVSAPYTRFLDMLNSDMYVIFKIDNNNYNLPVYFKDSVGYEHKVVLSDGTSVMANQLLLNGIYPAKYQYTGGYIILDSLTPLNPDVINENSTQVSTGESDS